MKRRAIWRVSSTWLSLSLPTGTRSARGQEDVGGLQDGVAEQVVGDLLHVRGRGHVLDRGQLLQALHGDQAADEQLQLVGLVDGGLKAEGDFGRVDADGKMIHDDGAGVVRDRQDVGLVRLGREHVQVGDQEEAFVLVL